MQIDVLLAFIIIGSFLLAIPLHEYGHVLMASWLGDHTPKAEGRQTLRLRPHIDPLGTLLCVILAFQPVLFGPVGLGWGKPVKPDPWKLRTGPDRGVMLVALGGILASLVVGLVVGLVVSLVVNNLTSSLAENVFVLRLLQILVVFAVTNVGLALLNLVPFYPLDGYQILYSLLPSKQAASFAKSAPYGPFIILIIFFLVPFLAQFLGTVGALPIFHIDRLILGGAEYILALFFPGWPSSAGLVHTLYLLKLRP